MTEHLRATDLGTEQEIVVTARRMPLRLSFEPDAIREHFEGEAAYAFVEKMTDLELAEAGLMAVTDDWLYKEFHEALVRALAGWSDLADEETEDPWWDVDGVDIRELVEIREMAENTPNVVLLAEHQRSRGDVTPYGPYPTAAEAREAAIKKYRDGDFDVHGCFVDYKTLGI